MEQDRMFDEIETRSRGNFRRGAAVAGLLAALLTGCATPPTEPAALAEFEQTNDPLEPMNRYFFEVNRFLDFMFLRPWADTYRRIVPDFARERVHNVLRNMGEPIDFVNEILQGRAEDGGISVGRLVVNSTIGLGGMFDVATDFGLPSKEGDFGQTLYSWGASEGPYLVLPVLGPSNLRDAVGKGVDTAADPVGWAFTIGDLDMANYGRAGGEALDKRSEFVDQLDSLEKTSIDFYAQMRSMMRQRRAKELQPERMSSASAYPDMSLYSVSKTTAEK